MSLDLGADPMGDTVEAFALERARLVCLIGGGGKTTLMEAMARDLVAGGRQVVATTTTRIRRPRRGPVIVDPDVSQISSQLDARLEECPAVTVARSRLPEDKLRGFKAEQVDLLRKQVTGAVLLVEADGAAGRPLKAHAGHEPVIPGSTDLVVAVIGIDCIGRPINDDAVHRADLMRQRLGLPGAQTITPATVASVVLHPLGYLRQAPADARVMVMLNKVESDIAAARALACARALRQADRADQIERIVVGALRASAPCLHVV